MMFLFGVLTGAALMYPCVVYVGVKMLRKGRADGVELATQQIGAW